jgi:hypothetical protein
MKKISSVEGFIDFRKLIMIEAEEKRPCLVLCAGTGGQAHNTKQGLFSSASIIIS